MWNKEQSIIITVNSLEMTYSAALYKMCESWKQNINGNCVVGTIKISMLNLSF